MKNKNLILSRRGSNSRLKYIMRKKPKNLNKVIELHTYFNALKQIITGVRNDDLWVVFTVVLTDHPVVHHFDHAIIIHVCMRIPVRVTWTRTISLAD